MQKIDNKIKQIKSYIKEKTNNDPDTVFKEISFFNSTICVIFSESLTSRDVINNYILEYIEEVKLHQIKRPKNILSFLEDNIPSHKVVKASDYEELFYNLFSGFALICVDGYDEILCYETRLALNSNISESKNEKVIKGPKDAFTENYQINIGMIKRRIKNENLWLYEAKVGKYSQTKIGIMHVNGIASPKLVEIVKNKIEQINIDAIIDSNYIIESISGNRKDPFPTYLSTERPDLVQLHLLEGKIAIVVENSPRVIIIPALFTELFHSSEDYYQKSINATYTRIVRLLGFLITVLTPAIYIAMTTYNHEAIPSKLLINFSTQRDGVPFPAIFEAIIMLATFEILKETDTRIPNVIGSSLSIVGALVLGEAAVTAGIVSPIMVIVIAITSISGFILSYFDAINGIRLWRLMFLIFASFAGIIGIVVAGLLFIINISSIESLGLPYLTPLVPLIKKDLGDNIFLTNKRRLFKRKSYLTDNITKGRE